MTGDQDGPRTLLAVLTIIDELSGDDDRPAAPIPGQLVLEGLDDVAVATAPTSRRR